MYPEPVLCYHYLFDTLGEVPVTVINTQFINSLMPTRNYRKVGAMSILLKEK